MKKYNSSSHQKRDGLFLKIIEAFLYLTIVHLSYTISLRFELLAPYDERNFIAYHDNFLWFLLGAYGVFLFNNVFKTAKKSLTENIVIMFMSTSMIAIASMSIAFMTRGFALPRTVVLQAFFIQWILLSLVKCCFVKFVNKLRGTKRMMIVAEMNRFEEIVQKVLSDRRNKDEIAYFVSPEEGLYLKYIDKVDKILISEDIPATLKNDIISRCIVLDKSLYIVPRTFEIAIYNSEIIQILDYLAFRVDTLHLSMEKQLIKRAMDILISTMGIILASPIMLLASLAILISDGRPVFFTQERATLNNKTFKLVKFRSMVKDAEKDTGAIWATENDPRVTKVGRFLRRFWIDELPQLFNVLKGDMSMVGPRPERPVFIEEFAETIPDFHYRMTVKAGVTGLAQVLGKYSTSPENKIKFDLMYIRNASLMYDVKIIAETVKKILMGTLKRGENVDLAFEELIKFNKICMLKQSTVIRFKYN